MRIVKVTIFLVLATIIQPARADVWEKWDMEVVRQANTAADLDYMNEEEKKVILFMNLARMNGKLFADTFLEEYVGINGIERTGYVKSLVRDLKKTGDLSPLIPEKDLTSVAQRHATISGETGHTGHKDFKQRFEPLMGNPYQHVGENCSYGYHQAVDIVVSLLIDEGIKDVGHRKNILSESFNSVGVAVRSHKKYGVNCVIDFGRQIRSDLNELPF